MFVIPMGVRAWNLCVHVLYRQLSIEKFVMFVASIRVIWGVGLIYEVGGSPTSPFSHQPPNSDSTWHSPNVPIIESITLLTRSGMEVSCIANGSQANQNGVNGYYLP